MADPGPEVYPRRNLGKAEYWGRVVETRLQESAKAWGRSSSSLSGLARSDSALQGDMARQLEGLEENLVELQGALQQLQGALLLTPSSSSNAASTSGFALTAGWNTVLSFNLPIPGGKTNLNVVANGRVTVKDDGPSGGGGGGGGYFQWPFSLNYVTSEYGWRGEGAGVNFHSGIDFAGGPATGGNPIFAPADGIVLSKGSDGGRGNYLNLWHEPGLITRYFHLNTPSPLSNGQAVVRNSTVLGYVGNTGASFGAHLHWETYIEGGPLNEEGYPAMDPREFMSIYGGDSSPGVPATGEFANIYSRVVISGNNSLDFESYRILYNESDPDFYQHFLYPIHGLKYTGSAATVNLDVYVSADVPADSFNTASLSAFGVFA